MNIFFHILAVYVRTGDHGKCSRIIKIASNWPDVQILLLQHIPRLVSAQNFDFYVSFTKQYLTYLIKLCRSSFAIVLVLATQLHSSLFGLTGRHHLWVHMCSLNVMTMYLYKSKIVSNVECLSIRLVLFKSFTLRFLVSWERTSITVVKNFSRYGELSKKLNNSWKESITF